MFHNYLICALRDLARNRLYAVINIVGLAVGLTAAILIGLYLRDEFSYDHWIPGYRQVYRMEVQEQFRQQNRLLLVPFGFDLSRVASWLKAGLAGIQAVGRLAPQGMLLRRGSTQSRGTVYWADPELFDVLPFPALSGDPARALESPDAIVLTRRMARRYFGRDDPLGETLQLDGHLFHVAAVLRDMPSETNFAFQIFASARSPFSALPPADAPPSNHMVAPVSTFLRLRAGADAAVLTRQLTPVMLQHVVVPRDRAGKPLFPLPTISLQPLSRLHFVHGILNNVGFDNTTGKAPASLAADSTLGVVGVLIVLIAAFNFVNLTTARAARRAVEVGIRKVAGATTHDLLLQFLGESLLTVIIAGLIAVALVELLVPQLDAFLTRDIVFAWWREAQVGGSLAVLVLAVGVLGGLYPAVVLSGFRPATVLRGGPLPAGGRAGVRGSLVVLQFAVLIALIVTTAVVYRQIRFATGDSLRFDTDQVLVIYTDCANAFPDEIRALPGVRAAACTNTAFGTAGGSLMITPHGSEANSVMMVNADWGLLRLFGLDPLAGRFFSRDHPGDAAKTVAGPAGMFGTGGTVVINETAARKLGFASPEAAVGHALIMPGIAPRPSIIGVAPDIELQGVRSEIVPTLYRLLPQYRFLVVKLAAQEVPETLMQIDRLWGRLGTGLPIVRSFLDQDIQLQYLDVIREAQVFAAFAGIAALIACLGLLGLVAFMAEQRTREIGVRKAMGAATGDILRLLLWQFSQPVLIANLVAWPVAGYLMSRWLRGFYYHVALSWWLFAAAGLAALAVALATVGAHAYAVARERPVSALRYE